MAGKAIIVKVQGEADFKEVQSRIDRVFGAARQRAQDAADGIERSLEASGEGAVRAAQRASDAFSGVSRTVARELNTASDGVDFNELTARANEAFRRIRPDELAARLEGLPDEVRPGALRDAYDQALRNVSTEPLQAKLRNLVDQADAALAGRDLGEGLRRGLESTDLQGMVDFLERGRRVDVSPVVRNPLDFGAINSNIGAIFGQGLDTSGVQDRVARMQDEIRGQVGRLPPFFRTVGEESGQSLGDGLDEALADLPNRFDRTNQRLAAEVRKLAETLPREAVPAAAELANALDPRPFTARKFDGLQDQLARVARDLPDEFKPAALKIADVLEDSARKIPPPFKESKSLLSRIFGEVSSDAKREADETDDAFRRAANNIPNHFDGVGSGIRQRMSGLGRSIGNTLQIAIGNALANLGGNLASDVSSFFGDAVGLAVDAEAFTNRIDFVFGSAAGKVLDFSKTTSKSLGLSQRQSIDLLGGFGNQFVQYGLSVDDAANRSVKLTQIVGDLAALNNLDPSKLGEAVQAAVRGEYDSLQRALPKISQARINEEALSLAHKKRAKDLTELEKLEGLYSVLLKDSGAANGFFAENAESAAIQLAKQAAQMEDLQTQLGVKLIPLQLKWKQAQLAVVRFLVEKGIPAVEGLARVLGPSLAPAFKAVQRSMSEFFTGLSLGFGERDLAKGFFGEMGADIRSFFDTLRTGDTQSEITTAAERAAQAVRDFGAGLRDGFTAGDQFASKAKKAGIDLRSFFEALFTGKIQNEEPTGFEQAALKIRDFAGWLATNGPKIAAAVGAIFGFFIEHPEIALAILAVVKGFKAMSAVVSIVEAISGVFALLASPIGIAAVAIGLLVGGFVYAYRNSESFRAKVAEIVEDLKTKFGELVDKVREIGDKLGELDWSAVEAQVAPLLESVGSALVGLVSAVSAIAGVISFLAPILGPVLVGGIQLAMSALTGLFNFFSGVFNLISGILTGDWSRAWEGAKQVVSGFVQFFTSTFLGFLGPIAQALGVDIAGIKDNMAAKLDEIVSFVAGLPGRIASAATGLWDGLKTGLSAVVTWIEQQINRIISVYNAVPGVPDAPLLSTGPARRATKVIKGAATGDVAYRQQVRLIGDNYRAASDPEIVAPQSHIAAAVAEALQNAELGQQGPQRVFNIDKIVTPPGRDLWQEVGLMERVLAQV